MDRDINIAKKYGIGYLSIPKNGCSSFKSYILKLKKPEIFEKLTKDEITIYVHTEGYEFLSYKDENLEDYFIFTFVRNPYSRFLSFYKSKILSWDSYLENHLNEIGLYYNMPFHECVKRVKDYPPEYLDPHIRPQHMFICHNGELLPDFIGQIEHIDKLFKYISVISNHSDLYWLHKTRSDKLRHLLTDELKEILYSYYRQDFFLFNYDAKVPDTGIIDHSGDHTDSESPLFGKGDHYLNIQKYNAIFERSPDESISSKHSNT